MIKNRSCHTIKRLDTIAYSYDGIKWTGLGQSIFSNSGLCISFNGQLYIAIGSGAVIRIRPYGLF